ncbi:MAG: cytochrome P450 [Actinomycetia bacterium]|nr:cytochrome P450 [Actinomycetes bacterium]
MSTATPTASPFTTLSTLPRPRSSAAAWAKLFMAPEAARQELTRLGERFVLKVPLMPTMMWTSSPEDVRAVFQDKSGALSFGTALRRMAPHEIVFGDRIMTWWASDNHTEMRRAVTPAFMGKALQGYRPAMEDVARRMVRELPTDTPIRFHSYARTMAREVIMSVVFGVTEPQRRSRLAKCMDDLDQLIGSKAMELRYAAAMMSRGRWLPFPALDRVLSDLDRVTHEEIAARRAAPATDRSDCLAVFLRIQEANKSSGMDDEMIAGFQRLLLVAGNDTTAATLSWVIERLARHPQVLARLEDSLAADDDTYLDAVITETLRLRPTVPFTARMINRDVVINNTHLPQGSMVWLYINAIHRSADLYDAPDEFRPERFLGTPPDPYHWLPFGGGINRCLGAHMSQFEMRVLLRTILQELTVAPETSRDEAQQAQTVLILPKKRATVTLNKRTGPLAQS